MALTVVLGPAGLGMSLAMAGMIGGMAGGALSGALAGGARGALIGGIVGGVLGAFGGWGVQNFGPGFGVGMLAAGAAYAGATDNWDSLAGGLIGGIAGAAVGGGIVNAYSDQFQNFKAGKGFINNADLKRINSMKVLGQLDQAVRTERAVQASAFNAKATADGLAEIGPNFHDTNYDAQANARMLASLHTSEMEAATPAGKTGVFKVYYDVTSEGERILILRADVPPPGPPYNNPHGFIPQTWITYTVTGTNTDNNVYIEAPRNR